MGILGVRRCAFALSVFVALLCASCGHGQVQELTKEPSCVYHELCLALLDDVRLQRALCVDDADAECAFNPDDFCQIPEEYYRYHCTIEQVKGEHDGG